MSLNEDMLILQIKLNSVIGNSFFIGNTKCGDIGNTRFNTGSEWENYKGQYPSISHIVIETLKK